MLYIIHKDDFMHICYQFRDFMRFLRERAILRRAHFMRIQSELYKSYTDKLDSMQKKTENLIKKERMAKELFEI